MAAGFITKTVGDGNSGTFSARFFSSDGTTGGLLYPAPVLTDPAGAQAIGTVGAPEAGTMLKLLTDTLSTMQSIRDATNTVNTADDSNTVYAGATALTPKRGVINLSATGDLQALVSGKKIRVMSMMYVCSAALTVKFTSGTGPTDITGPMSHVANGGMPFSESKKGLFETAAGAKLSMSITGTGTVAGFYTYVEV